MIALVTEIPRFYYSAAKELRERGIEFMSLNLKEEIPPTVRVVLTSEGEKGKIRFEKVVAKGDVSSAVDECLRILKGFRADYGKLVIGIDPGLKPGIAVLGDGKVILVEGLNSPEEVQEAVERILNIYSGEEVIFRVGKGGGIYKTRILKALQEGFSHPIETVDEERTTPIVEPALKDIMAAVNIAIKRGKALKKKVELYPKPGEIRNLQKKSRALSGTITISKALAEKVARGELTLEEAIRIQKK